MLLTDFFKDGLDFGDWAILIAPRPFNIVAGKLDMFRSRVPAQPPLKHAASMKYWASRRRLDSSRMRVPTDIGRDDARRLSVGCSGG